MNALVHPTAQHWLKTFVFGQQFGKNFAMLDIPSLETSLKIRIHPFENQKTVPWHTQDVRIIEPYRLYSKDVCGYVGLACFDFDSPKTR